MSYCRALWLSGKNGISEWLVSSSKPDLYNIHNFNIHNLSWLFFFVKFYVGIGRIAAYWSIATCAMSAEPKHGSANAFVRMMRPQTSAPANINWVIAYYSVVDETPRQIQALSTLHDIDRSDMRWAGLEDGLVWKLSSREACSRWCTHFLDGCYRTFCCSKRGPTLHQVSNLCFRIICSRENM